VLRVALAEDARRTSVRDRKEAAMARYLFNVSYTQSGVQGVLKEGGSSRRDSIAKVLAEMGGTMESFDFAFGEDDVIVIVDVPDAATAAALSMSVGASGAARIRTTPLISPEEIDRASNISVGYRPPGS
jgi:uncharacterized protein with GYD domain